jgi:pimeloyl-ACP methyl ester carboxylesterase
VPGPDLPPSGGPTCGYAPVNGLQFYYEIHGAGPPLVLLHGGLLTLELSFGSLIPALAEDHQVIGVELQGHGRTADIDRPMTLEDLADDVGKLLDHLGVRRADIFGFSLGGAVEVFLAEARPELVGRLVVASMDLRPDHAEFRTPDEPDVARRMPTEADFQAMRDAYDAVAPDPSQFDRVAEKTSAMVHGFNGWSDDRIRSLRPPVLLLVGDTDFTPLDHAIEMLGLLPNAQLAVLPGTTHMGMTRRPDLILPLVRRFLAERD